MRIVQATRTNHLASNGHIRLGVHADEVDFRSTRELRSNYLLMENVVIVTISRAARLVSMTRG